MVGKWIQLEVSLQIRPSSLSRKLKRNGCTRINDNQVPEHQGQPTMGFIQGYSLTKEVDHQPSEVSGKCTVEGYRHQRTSLRHSYCQPLAEIVVN